jgi:hypothetical protein
MFRYDEKKVPRTWQPGDNIDAFYQTVIKQSEHFLAECATVPLSFKYQTGPSFDVSAFLWKEFAVVQSKPYIYCYYF